MRVFASILAAAVIGLSGAASAHEYKVGPIEIGHPWARATTINVTAAFMTLHNTGKTADRLVSVSTPVAKKAALHVMAMKNGVARMHRVDGIAVAPGKTVVLEPGGFHIMLMGLRYPVKKGFKVPLTLRFEKAGIITVRAEVAKPGAMGPADDDEH
jgi:copper(I)-binding protein